MDKERYEREHEWIIDNNKRKTKESIIVYDEEWNTLDDICELLNKQDQKIADLEAKLAESEAEYNDTCQHYEHQIAELGKEVNRLCKREKLLEQQLAESEKRILEWQEDSIRDNQIYNEHLAEKEKEIETQKSNIEFLYDLFVSPKGEQTLKAINQDKISFAVEQLEKVKELLAERSVKIISSVLYISTYDAQKTIDNQIKQLKEME